MPRDGHGYDSMHVCGYCIEFLTSVSSLRLQASAYLTSDYSYSSWQREAKDYVFEQVEKIRGGVPHQDRSCSREGRRYRCDLSSQGALLPIFVDKRGTVTVGWQNPNGCLSPSNEVC